MLGHNLEMRRRKFYKLSANILQGDIADAHSTIGRIAFLLVGQIAVFYVVLVIRSFTNRFEAGYRRDQPSWFLRHHQGTQNRYDFRMEIGMIVY